MNSLRLHFYLWLLGAVEATFQGGALGVKAFVGLAVAHSAGAEVPTLDLEQLYYVFLFGAIYHFCNYVTEHSLLAALFNLARPAVATAQPTMPKPADLAEQPNNQAKVS